MSLRSSTHLPSWSAYRWLDDIGCYGQDVGKTPLQCALETTSNSVGMTQQAQICGLTNPTNSILSNNPTTVCRSSSVNHLRSNLKIRRPRHIRPSLWSPRISDLRILISSFISSKPNPSIVSSRPAKWSFTCPFVYFPHQRPSVPLSLGKLLSKGRVWEIPPRWRPISSRAILSTGRGFP